MKENRKPRLGLLGLMTDGYEPIFPGITKRQEAYARQIADELADSVELCFLGATSNRESIERRVAEMNAMELDGLLIILLTYSQGSWLVRALQGNRLPLALAVVQPDAAVEDDWDELKLTVNQGVHGAQDNACAINRLGIPCQFFAGDRRDEAFRGFVLDFGKAAQTCTFLRRMKVGVIGKMAGMNDILADEMSVLSKIGPEYRYDGLGMVAQFMAEISKAEIDERIAYDREMLDIDPKLSYESYAEAIRMYLSFRKYLEAQGLDAFTAQFDLFAQDGRFKQLPLLAASHLMADGYGYAAEGDSLCAAMVAAAHCIGDGTNGGNFTEMYTMDFKRNAIIFCHAGEGNWATHRRDVRPQIIDRYLGEGGLANPPTPRFMPEPGRATLTSLAPVCGERFRLLVGCGNILSEPVMPHNEMPHFFWQPDCGPAVCVERWCRFGGTHHEVINLGDVSRRWRMLADMLEIEHVEI